MVFIMIMSGQWFRLILCIIDNLFYFWKCEIWYIIRQRLLVEKHTTIVYKWSGNYIRIVLQFKTIRLSCWTIASSAFVMSSVPLNRTHIRWHDARYIHSSASPNQYRMLNVKHFIDNATWWYSISSSTDNNGSVFLDFRSSFVLSLSFFPFFIRLRADFH